MRVVSSLILSEGFPVQRPLLPKRDSIVLFSSYFGLVLRIAGGGGGSRHARFL